MNLQDNFDQHTPMMQQYLKLKAENLTFCYFIEWGIFMSFFMMMQKKRQRC